MDIFNLTYELKKCKECGCSRCVLCGTPSCYVEIAIKELNRYDQAMDALKAPITDVSSEVAWENMDHVK